MRAERWGAPGAHGAPRGKRAGSRTPFWRARAELLAEKKYEADLRRIERANRKRCQEAPRVTRIERQAENDDEVRSNLSTARRPVRARETRDQGVAAHVAHGIFPPYAAKPDEVLAAVDDKTDALIRHLEASTARRAARCAPAAPLAAPQYTPSSSRRCLSRGMENSPA